MYIISDKTDSPIHSYGAIVQKSKLKSLERARQLTDAIFAFKSVYELINSNDNIKILNFYSPNRPLIPNC